MWRYYYTIGRNIFRIQKEVKTMKKLIELSKTNQDKYDEESRYRYVQKNIVETMQKT